AHFFSHLFVLCIFYSKEMFCKGGILMSLSLPFPTGLYRAIGENQVAVVAHDDEGVPTAVCVFADSAFERAAALVLLENRPDSFVVSHGHRYSPGGRVEVYDPSQPW